MHHVANSESPTVHATWLLGHDDIEVVPGRDVTVGHHSCTAPTARNEPFGSHDLVGALAPVAVAELTLVQLAGRQPREFGLVVDRTRHLLA